MRRGAVELTVEDEEPTELGRDLGNVIVRIFALELGECCLQARYRLRRVPFPKVDIAEHCRDAGRVFLEALDLKGAVCFLQKRTSALRAGAEPRHSTRLLQVRGSAHGVVAHLG